MWHELVLHGIGGNTVEEAKEKLSYQEAQNWFIYMKQHGGISHTDRLLATIATQINRLTGGEADIGDFLPILKTTNNEASIGDLMNILSKAAL